MKTKPKKSLRIAIAALTLAGVTSLAKTPSKQELNEEAIALVKQFAGTLKPELKQALETGGPVAAVEVCSIKAPAIAQNLSSESGWTIHRVSLKPRNPSAAPNDWETKALEALAERQVNNDGTDSLVFSELLEHEFRLIKAQTIEPLCTTCHGTDIATDVRKALENFYPEDQGTGYFLGEVRGGISLSKSLQR